MIIDGSCTNLVGTEVVEKLDIHTSRHPHPYTLQWLNVCGAIRVTKQAMISFKLGRFNDEVLCDVVPMHMSHLILGRPWQYERRVLYDAFRNRYSLHHQGRTLTLVSLTPEDAHEDIARLAKHREEMKNIEKNNNKVAQESESDVLIEEREINLEVIKELVDKDIVIAQEVDTAVVIKNEEFVANLCDAVAIQSVEFEEESPTNLVGDAKVIQDVEDTKSAGLHTQLQEVHVTSTYYDPFLLHCTPLNFVIADLCVLDFKLYKRTITELFASLILLIVCHYGGLLTYIGPILVFDPGGFEDESFLTGRD